MRSILAGRGGGSQEIMEYVLIPSLKDFTIMSNRVKTPLVSPLLNPAQIGFQENCNLMTQNIFREHTARR